MPATPPSPSAAAAAAARSLELRGRGGGGGFASSSPEMSRSENNGSLLLIMRSYSPAVTVGKEELPPSGSGRLLSVRDFFSLFSLLEDFDLLLLRSFSPFVSLLESVHCVESAVNPPSTQPLTPDEDDAGSGEVSFDLGFHFLLLHFLAPFLLARRPATFRGRGVSGGGVGQGPLRQCGGGQLGVLRQVRS